MNIDLEEKETLEVGIRTENGVHTIDGDPVKESDYIQKLYFDQFLLTRKRMAPLHPTEMHPRRPNNRLKTFNYEFSK